MDAQKLELLRKFTEELVPFNRCLGLSLVDASEGMARVSFDFRPELVGNYTLNILHGGAISTALDMVGGAAVMTTYMEQGQLHGLGTVDMRVDFLHPGSGRSFIATGTVVRPGRMLCATRMELENDEGKLIAMATAVYRVSTKERTLYMNV